jgi:ABC-2 type transport system ATP-binding protein
MRRMKQVMKRLARDGAAVILSSHLLALVEEVCTHLLVLKNGRKIVDGSVEAVRARFGAGEDDSLEDVFFRATEEPGEVAPP